MTNEILEGVICPECGSSVINDGYDMDFNVMNCHCSYCDWEGNDSQCMSVDDDDEDEPQSEYIVDGVDTRTGEPVNTNEVENDNEVYVVTYLYDDDNGVTAYSNVFRNLANAVTDAQISQSEFTRDWDEDSFDEDHYKEASGVGSFTCIDDDSNSLIVTIKKEYIR